MEYRCKDEQHDKYKGNDIILPINSPPKLGGAALEVVAFGCFALNSPPFLKEACPSALRGKLPWGWLYLAVLH